MHLAEREEEFDVLKRLFARCLERRGQIALITGGLAHGKTELLNAFADYAIESGALLLTAAASRAEQTICLGVMRQLFDEPCLPPSVAHRGSGLLNRYELSPGDAHAGAADGPDLRTMHSLCAAILGLARQRSVVIVVDDVQYIDDHSLEALLYLQRRMRLSRLLVILNEWEQPRPTRRPLYVELARLPYFTKLRLNPLSPAGVSEVVSQHAAPHDVDRLAFAIHEASGGNPFLVHALVEDYLTSDRRGRPDDGKEPQAGEFFKQAVMGCLHRWEPRLLEVARGVALLGDFGEPAVLARLLGMPVDAVGQTIDVLTTAGLLIDGRFRHPVARSAVLETIAPEEFTALRLRAAALLHDRGTPSRVVAEHLVAAGEATESWAVEVLCEAADDALAGDEISTAVEFLDLARSACTDEREQALITIRLAHVEWRIRPATSNVHIVRLRTAVQDGYLDGTRATVLIKYLLWHGLTGEAARTLTMMLDAAATEHPQLATELRLTYHVLSHSHPPFFPRIPERMVSADELEHHAMHGFPWVRGPASLASVLSHGPSETAIHGAEHVLHSTPLTDETLDLLLIALLALIYADRPDKAAPWCERLLDEARHRDAGTWLAVLSNVRADIAMRQGNLPVAAEHATTALAKMSSQNWGVGIGSPLSTLILASVGMGDLDGAARLLRHPVPTAMFQTWFAPQYLHARGQYFLATNKVVAALGDFQQCGALMTHWQIDLPSIAPWRGDTALAYLELGRRDEASKLVGEQLAMPNIGVRTKGMSLRLLAATREMDERIPILDEAACLQGISGDAVEQAMTLAELSRERRARGELDTARSLRERAIDIARDCHAMTLCRELASGGQVLGGDEAISVKTPEIPSALSKSEWRVASLAALGHTNRAISRKLSITVSTVEQHLTRVYRKLNVNRRTELPAGLRAQRAQWQPEPASDEDSSTVGCR